MGLSVPTHPIRWKQSWRIIPTRYPVTSLYSRIAPPEDHSALSKLENLTNDRARLEKKGISLLRKGDFFLKKCSMDIKAAFAYLNPSGSRFSDGSYPVYYTASTLKTAIKESAYHRALFLKRTQEPPLSLQMRVLISHVDAACADLRGLKKVLSSIYSPTHYQASQKFGRDHWSQGAQGIVYDSVRHLSGECAAIFSPQTLSHGHQDRCLIYEWNGKTIRKVYSLQEFPRF